MSLKSRKTPPATSPPNSRPPSRPPSMKPPIAPIRPPNMLGRGELIGPGAGRAGVMGVRGDTGEDGCAGGEYEREPRLPPPPARAHASVVTAASVSRVSSAITVSGRSFIARFLQPTVMG